MTGPPKRRRPRPTGSGIDLAGHVDPDRRGEALAAVRRNAAYWRAAGFEAAARDIEAAIEKIERPGDGG